MNDNKIQLFGDKRIRTAWDEENEEWLFSIVGVAEVPVNTYNPWRYWNDLKQKWQNEGSQLYGKIVQLK
jgi:predicted negative regulator of RcsB-dependent stress response